jgi:eukaryotic-like serine/threonine-protein kinase
MDTAMQTIPGYHIKTLLGTGGMASVYLAIQKSLSRPVAIKVLDAQLSHDSQLQAQFEQESSLVAKLNHPNIIQVIDRGTTDQGLPFFVMPYVKSISLDAIVERDDININRKIDILLQLCSALAYAHRNGIIHRDVKPQNVLVDYEGIVRLVDFGIAGYFTANNSDTKDERVMGTEEYMPPEQHSGVSFTSQASDIYSFGMLMHKLLFGLLPSECPNGIQNLKPYANTTEQTYLKAMIPIIKQSISPKAFDRPASITDVKQQLLVIAQGRHLQSNRWGLESTQDRIPPNYQLLDVLKENPFGATYLVSDPKHDRFLVIKKQGLKQLANAPQAVAKLKSVEHPHIIRVLGSGKNERIFIVVSEYLAGGSLQDRLTHAFTLGQWMLMTQQICSGLACAHEQGIIHGNLRPSNILIAADNHIKLSDFGFPAHTYGDDSHWYQIKGEKLSVSGDIYAAGAIVFQRLTGKIPSGRWWGLKNHWDLRHIPKKFRNILLKMIHLNPKKRFPKAEKIADALNALRDGEKTQILEKFVFNHP